MELLTPNQRAGRTRRDRTRQQVLAATHELLKDRSYDDLRVADIVKAANIGEATLYQVFRHKAAVVASLFLEHYQPIEADAERETTDAAIASTEVLSAFLMRLATLAQAEPALARAYLRAFVAEAYMREPLPDALDDLTRPGAFCQSLLERGLRAGVVSHTLAVEGVGELLIVTVLQAVLRHGPDQGSLIARRLVEAMFGQPDDVKPSRKTRGRKGANT